MKDSVVATNSDGRMTLINPAASVLLGVTEDEGVGRPLADFAPGLEPFLHSAMPASGPEAGEIILPLSGSPRTYDVQTVPIPSGRDHDGGTIITLRDITDRKNAETGFKKANRKLNLLSGIVRHDIKNKLDRPLHLPPSRLRTRVWGQAAGRTRKSWRFGRRDPDPCRFYPEIPGPWCRRPVMAECRGDPEGGGGLSRLLRCADR